MGEQRSRLWHTAREYVTNWAVGGLIIMATGFAPEELMVRVARALQLPENSLHLWSAGFDVRTLIVLLGVVIVVGDLLLRRRTLRVAHLSDTSGVATGTTTLPAAAKQVGDTARNKSAALPLPDKPSIAVLPFQNMSGDANQEYFADGVVEEIITALSRFQQLFVIARSSSFTYKGRPTDVTQVGRELGVRYILEGAVRKAADRVRITAQLVDAATGSHLWADRFDGELKDIFDLQDRVTTCVVGAISPHLEQAEIDRARRKPTENLDAYDYYLRGLASYYHLTRVGIDEALRAFNRAIELDPDFASAYSQGALCYVLKKGCGWMTAPQHDVAEGARLARRGAELGRNDAEILWRTGIALAHLVGDFASGTAFIDEALSLNANMATAWFSSAYVRVWLGQADIALDHAARAMRLSPLDPQVPRLETAIASAHFVAGRYQDAVLYAEKSLRGEPNWAPATRIAAASYALLGRSDEALKAMVRVHQVDPELRVSNLKERAPYQRIEDIAKLTEGLRKAGLAE
jgi:TolB-like protein